MRTLCFTDFSTAVGPILKRSVQGFGPYNIWDYLLYVYNNTPIYKQTDNAIHLQRIFHSL